MWTILLSIRYFLAKQKEGMISFINLASVLGVALGVASLIIVIAVMNGFNEEVKNKIIGTYAHITVMGSQGPVEPATLAREMREVPGVKSVAPFITGQAILRKDKVVTGVLLKGIDVRKEYEVTDVISFIVAGRDSQGEKGPGSDKDALTSLAGGGIILGAEIMNAAGISVGDTVELMVPYSKTDLSKLQFTVTGSFRSGRYDYDSNVAVIDLSSAQELFRMKGAVSGAAVRLFDGTDVESVKTTLQKKLGFYFIVKSWMDLDRNLMTALAMEKKMMFIVLGIIVIVACFNITSSLIMMVMEKTRDIGILKSIGASSFGVSSIFLIEGFLVGLMGISLGGSAGMYIAEHVNDVIAFLEKVTGLDMFPSDVYYFTNLPVLIRYNDVMMILGVAVLLALLSGIYPAWKASRLDPVEAIRYE